MKYVSTRNGLAATSAETVFRGLAPDGGLYVPVLGNGERGPGNGERGTGNGERRTGGLADAERFVLSRLFDDIPESVREAAVERLLS